MGPGAGGLGPARGFEETDHLLRPEILLLLSASPEENSPPPFPPPPLLPFPLPLPRHPPPPPPHCIASSGWPRTYNV